MKNFKGESNNPNKNASHSPKESDFSYPFDNPNFGARSYTKDGITIYEIEIPFSLDEYEQVTEEKYNAFIDQRTETRQRQYQEQMEQKKKFEQLRDLGYTSELGIGANEAYQDQLLKVMKENELTHINQIPAHLEIQKGDTSLALFQTIAVRDSTPDFYTQEIIKHLEKYEQQIETEFVNEEEFVWLSTFFSNGYIKDVELFHRFEQLKRQNVINHCKRLIHYGSCERDMGYNKYGSKVIKKGYNPTESTEISEYDMDDIIVYMRIKNIQISEIESDESKLIEKVKHGFKQRQKKFLLGEDLSMNDAYSLTMSYGDKLYSIIKISRETRLSRYQEAEMECIDEINQTIENKLNHFSIEERNNISEIFEKINPRIDYLDQNKKKLLYQDLADILSKHINLLIEKILNREKINKGVSHRDSFMLKYEYWIDKISAQIDILQKQLETIAPETAQETGRREHREQYISEYKTYFRESFIEKRLKQAYDGDLSNTEAIREKAISDIKKTFLSSMISIGKENTKYKTQSGMISKDRLGSRGNVTAMKKLKAAFLNTGHSLLLKKLYPDNTQRRSLRQEYTQIVTKDILKTINQHLTNPKTFKLEEYYIRRQINHVYQKYGGTEKLLNHEQEIDTIVNKMIRADLLPNGRKIISNIQTEFTQGEPINPKSIYEPIGDFFWYILNYFNFFLNQYGLANNKENKEISEEEIREKNQIRQEILPAAMIDDLSHQKQEIDTIHDHFEPEVFENFVTLYKELEPHRIQILDIILQHRFLQNAQAGGKLQRLTIDHLYSYKDTHQNSDDIILFLESEIEKIIITDLRGPIYGVNLLSRDEQLIKEYIHNYTQQFIQKIKLGEGERISKNKYLTK